MSNLADVRDKKTVIKIGEKELALYYDLNSFAELEEKFGSVEQALLKLGSKNSAGKIKTIRTILWAGLLHSNEELTEQEVGKLFDLTHIEEICEGIDIAITKSVPVEEDEEEPTEKTKKSKNVKSPSQ